MIRIVLTLWYTAMAFIGPGVCCCSFHAAAEAAPTVFCSIKSPATKKNCCSTQTDAPTPTSKAPAKHQPGDCPCKHHKAAYLPPHVASANGAETFGQFRAGNFSLFDSTFLPMVGVTKAHSALAGKERVASASKPGGRDLLTAYQILRC